MDMDQLQQEEKDVLNLVHRNPYSHWDAKYYLPLNSLKAKGLVVSTFAGYATTALLSLPIFHGAIFKLLTLCEGLTPRGSVESCPSLRCSLPGESIDDRVAFLEKPGGIIETLVKGGFIELKDGKLYTKAAHLLT